MLAGSKPFTISRAYLSRFLSAATAKKLLLAAMVAAGSVLLSFVLFISNGSFVAGVAVLGLIAIVLITLYRVDWGFYIFIFMVFFFDQYAPPGFPTLGYSAGYFLNMNAISYLPSIKEGVVTPMELQLMLIFLVWVIVAAVGKNIHLTPVPLRFTVIPLFLAVIGSIANGLAHGGDLVISIWETRALFYLGIMFIFVPQIIQTRQQLQTLIWFCIAGISFKAFQGAERYASLGFSFGSWPNVYETLTNHEDPVFIITLVILLIGFSLFQGHASQRRALLWLLPILILGYVAGQRRATYASFVATLLAFVVLLPKRERKTVLRVLVVFLIIFGAYLAAFWNSYSRLGSVAQQFRSTVTGEGNIRGEYKDRTSTLYRLQENYNLGVTFQAAPAVGVGFGKAYDKPLRPWGSDFALGDYLPHNQILWVFVKMGVIGGFLFWFFFNSFVFRGALVFSRLNDPYLKAFCAVCVVAVINQLVVSYADMQLAWYRNMIYLGLLMGLIPVLERLDKSPSSVPSQI